VPPSANLALKARAIFVPELERVFRRQVQILDRVAVNNMVTASCMAPNPSIGNAVSLRSFLIPPTGAGGAVVVNRQHYELG
jgi:hypothetical protein